MPDRADLRRATAAHTRVAFRPISWDAKSEHHPHLHGRELGVPVVQAIAARIWEIQKRLHVHGPIKGYGRLLETLPA